LLGVGVRLGNDDDMNQLGLFGGEMVSLTETMDD
jgi:hypothetical protein